MKCRIFYGVDEIHFSCNNPSPPPIRKYLNGQFLKISCNYRILYVYLSIHIVIILSNTFIPSCSFFFELFCFSLS